MSVTLQERLISVEEYVATEEMSPVKREYWNGRVYAMSGGSPAHAQLSFNAAVALGKRLQGHRCRGAGSDQRIKVEATGLATYRMSLSYARRSITRRMTHTP